VVDTPEPTAGPQVAGLSATFRHLDDPDVPWQQVKRIRTAAGTEASVWEKWLAFSPDPQYLSLYARWDPGVVVRRHGHYSPHVLFVIDGEMWCGDRHCPAGTHIELPFGAAFGPFVAGPEGTLLLEVMMGDPRSWGEDQSAFERVLAERGASALPDVPLTFPEWLSDLRDRWVAEPDPGKDSPR
jgi:hypothetical protein